jgi:proline racemase
MYDKMRTMEREHDHIRRMLLCEPRGSVARHVNLIVPPTREDCDAGVIVMEPTEYVPMSGSNTIATVTVLLETGMVAMKEPTTVVTLDMPGGVVIATATCANGKCESVEFDNVPCFVFMLDAEIHLEGLGTIKVDVAYGGMIYALVDVGAVGLSIDPQHARALAEQGENIRLACRDQLSVVHPDNPDIHGVSIVQFNEPFRGVGQVTRNTCICSPGRSDRSPTGTGLSARLAVLHARGQMKVGEEMTHSSIIGSHFLGRIKGETTVSGRPAIVPTIRGQAWVTGFHQYVLDSTDPYPQGYVVSDTWGVTGNLAQ